MIATKSTAWARDVSVEAPSAMTVRTVTDANGLIRLAPSWTALLADSSADGPFLTPEWMAMWWKHLKADHDLRVITVWRGDELLAIAPLILRRTSWWRLRAVPVLDFLGSGAVGADYLDVIVRRGSEAEAHAALTAEFESRRPGLAFTRMREGHAFSEAMVAGLRASGWRTAMTRSDVSPFIPLAGRSWQDYLGSLGAEHRYAFRRKLRALERRHTVTFARAGSETERSEALAVLFDLHEQRWATQGEPGALHTESLRAFHNDFTALALKRGWLRLYVLRLDGRPAAALYGLRYRDVFYFYQSGFDPALSSSSVGLVTLGLAIGCAIDEGVAEFDLLHGDEAYKSHWACDTRTLQSLTLCPPGLLGWTMLGSARMEHGLRRLAERVLPAPISTKLRAYVRSHA